MRRGSPRARPGSSTSATAPARSRRSSAAPRPPSPRRCTARRGRPRTLLAAIDAPVPVQQQTTPCSARPSATSRAAASLAHAQSVALIRRRARRAAAARGRAAQLVEQRVAMPVSSSAATAIRMAQVCQRSGRPRTLGRGPGVGCGRPALGAAARGYRRIVDAASARAAGPGRGSRARRGAAARLARPAARARRPRDGVRRAGRRAARRAVSLRRRRPGVPRRSTTSRAT